jgi:acetyl esterase/lipase
MKPWAIAVGLLVACASAQARTMVWQPAAGHTQIAIWPGAAPDAQPVPGSETVKMSKGFMAGKRVTNVTNVTRPTMTVYAPKGKNTGAAVVVLPGGGFQILAIDLEGTEACEWLTSSGITCVLLKYRVPSRPYVWQCHCRPHDLSISVPSLQDVQRTMRLVRFHAAQWHIDPHKVGVLGFSAGGFLVAEISTLFDRHLYTPVDAADQESARPDFAMPIYPGHLATANGTLNPNIPVSSKTPPTFLVQAEDDDVDGVKQSLIYYTALARVHVPAEMHLYAHGGHAFGLRRTKLPITGWPVLAEGWLRTIGIIGATHRSVVMRGARVRMDRCAVRPPGHHAVLQAAGAAQYANQQHSAEHEQQRDEQADERGRTRTGRTGISRLIRSARQEVQLRSAEERDQCSEAQHDRLPGLSSSIRCPSRTPPALLAGHLHGSLPTTPTRSV